MDDDRRASKRLAIELEGMYRRLDEDSDYSAVVLNISFNGICILCKEALDNRTKLEMRVSLETGELVFLIAEVCWQRPPDGETGRHKTGLTILEGQDNDLAQFERYYNLRVLYPPAEAE
jgi:hypothetical protein